METMKFNVVNHCLMHGGGYARKGQNRSRLDPFDAAPVCYDVEKVLDAVREWTQSETDMNSGRIQLPENEATNSMFILLMAAVKVDMGVLISVYKSIERHNQKAHITGRFSDIILFDGLTPQEQHSFRRAVRLVRQYYAYS